MWEVVLARLNARGAGSPNVWHARCPVESNHKRGDSRPSLRLWSGEKGLMCKCYKGCKWRDIAAAIGTPPQDWFREPIESQLKKGRRKVEQKEVAAYPYCEADGEVMYEKVRLEPKSFFFRRPGPGGRGVIYGLGAGYYAERNGVWRPVGEGDQRGTFVEECKPLLYNFARLKETASAPGGPLPVIVVEGEKDVETLRDIGLFATTSGGKGSWKWHFGEHLTRRRVVIVPDMDPPGLEHAAFVAASAIGHLCDSLRVVEGYPVPLGGDITDWLELHHKGKSRAGKKEAVVKLIQEQPEWKRHKAGAAG